MIDYDDKWEIWQGDKHKYGPAHRHKNRILKKLINIVEPKSILDVGCGDASFLLDLKFQSADYVLYGADISKKILDIAKKNVDAEFYILNIEKEKLDIKVDLAICADILEHCENDYKALENLRDMCDYLLITVPAGKMDRLDYASGHFRRYNRKDLVNTLQKTGYDVIKIFNWGFPFYPLLRFLKVSTNEKRHSGKFGVLQKVISHLFYVLFILNVFDRGDRIFVLAKVVKNERHIC